MSSAGRGPRLGGPQDNYTTPTWCINRLLEVWAPRCGIAVEPACGDGRIIEVIAPRRDKGGKGHIHWIAIDIRQEAIDQVTAKNLTPSAYVFNYLEADATEQGSAVETVITNPPYALAEQFLVQSRRLYPRAEIVFLLRLGFLASEGRVDTYQRLGMPDVYILPNRPSFTGKGKVDSCDYAWFLWPAAPRASGKVQMLNTTSIEKRKACFV